MIDKEDYEEPRCPFCKPQKEEMIPVQRVMDKLDGFLYSKDFEGAEKHINYWICEADAIGDKRGSIALYNEMLGLKRKIGDKDGAYKIIDEVLKFLNGCDFSDNSVRGTTFLNIATVYKSFGDSKKAVELYKKAEEIYKNLLKENDPRFGGLYNNTGLALLDLKEFKKAKEYFDNAISVMKNNENSEAEIAITYCNLATLAEDEKGLFYGKTQINGYLNLAKEYFDKCTLKDGNYAYACEKCAPAFDYYGDKEYADILNERARAIYERY